MKPPRHLVIFARRPAYGVGKRRLAAEAGDLEARRVQRDALAIRVNRLGRDPRWTTWVAVTPDRPLRWAAARGCPIPQGAGDLGQRLSSVTRRLPRGPVVIVGSDAPDIARQDVTEAFRRLGSADAVFGPAPDGGYWLVGLRQTPRRLDPFGRVRWSSPDALADTVRNLRGRRVEMLRVLEDVDDLAALRRFRDRRKEQHGRRPVSPPRSA